MDQKVTGEKRRATTELYTGKAGYYHHRAGYSPECIDYLLAAAGIHSGSAVADMGAGTGIVTLQMLERTDCTIYLVEPNPDMMAHARRYVTASNVEFRQTTAEDTAIPAHSVDLVVVGTAFHWFDAEKFRRECRRICKKNAKIALLRLYNFVPDIHEGNTSTDHSIRSGEEQAHRFFGPGGYEKKLFFHEELFDFRRFLGERLSDHKAPDPGDPGYEQFVQDAREAFSYFGAETVSNVFITSCLMGSVGDER